MARTGAIFLENAAHFVGRNLGRFCLPYKSRGCPKKCLGSFLRIRVTEVYFLNSVCLASYFRRVFCSIFWVGFLVPLEFDIVIREVKGFEFKGKVFRMRYGRLWVWGCVYCGDLSGFRLWISLWKTLENVLLFCVNMFVCIIFKYCIYTIEIYCRYITIDIIKFPFEGVFYINIKCTHC